VLCDLSVADLARKDTIIFSSGAQPFSTLPSALVPSAESSSLETARSRYLYSVVPVVEGKEA
jgi:hypothetical protein